MPVSADQPVSVGNLSAYHERLMGGGFATVTLYDGALPTSRDPSVTLTRTLAGIAAAIVSYRGYSSADWQGAAVADPDGKTIVMPSVGGDTSSTRLTLSGSSATFDGYPSNGNHLTIIGIK